jgi:D-amino peptidase
VLLVTGDDAVCRESKDLLGSGLTTVAVKKGLSQYSARQIPPVRAREMIEEGAFKALKRLDAVKPYVPKTPCTITVELGSVQSALKFKGRPGVEIPEPLKVVSKGKDWQSAWDQIWGWDV